MDADIFGLSCSEMDLQIKVYKWTRKIKVHAKEMKEKNAKLAKQLLVIA